MPGRLINVDRIPDDVVQYVASRDAALWVGGGQVSSPATIDVLAQLIRLPWRLVLVEDPSESLARALEDQSPEKEGELPRRRGFVQLIGRDPVGVVLPPRVLPVYLLNGREGATANEESPRLGVRGSTRRRLNMTAAMVDSRPQALVVLLGQDTNVLEEVKGLWGEGLRTKLYFFGPHAGGSQAISNWIGADNSPPAITYGAIEKSRLIEDLLSRFNSIFGSERLLLRLRTKTGGSKTLDVTESEHIQTPLLDRYILLQERDLRRLTPKELPQAEFNAFFDGSQFSWKPNAAGLPWPRDVDAQGRLLKLLQRVEAIGPDENAVRIIPSEPGAGGSTLARQIAYEAAQLGFPTLVAKQSAFIPDLTEISRFMLRVWQLTLQDAAGTAAVRTDEVPWLLVFDAQHFRGREADMLSFARRLTQERRPAVILAVVEADRFREIDNPGLALCESLTHSISRDDAELIGTHINQFLDPKNARTPAQWRSFWENHGPRIGSFGSHPAAFWVAMEFWLKDQLDLRDSVQDWLFRQFKSASMSPQLRRETLTIAALSVERQPYPEELLPSPAPSQYPLSVQLEGVREAVPGLALVRLQTETGRQWAVAHDLLARYLLTAVFRDSETLRLIELENVRDPVELRLALLKTVAGRPELAQQRFLPLTNEFAVNILKLDRGRNREFFGHWRQVLQILEEMPEAVWNVSRTLNHHVAISRRRVATDDQLFQLTVAERREQLELAIEHLTYALSNLPAGPVEEPDVNLFNSLALAYQNLASLERSEGSDPELVKKLARLGTETARKAQNEDPSNNYVLETLARDLIQNGELYPEQAVESACQALQFIFRALSLDTAPARQQKLSELTGHAVALLRGPAATVEVDKLYRARKPVGFAAKAWLALSRESGGSWNGIVLGNVSHTGLLEAIHVLEDLPPPDRDWLVLNLLYDLISAAKPRAFSEQFQILEDMLAAGLKLNVQHELDYAILLHIRGRHPQANEAFQSLRRRLRDQDAFVTVPDRLRMLVREDTGDPILCDMLVLDTGGYRSRAKVVELPGAEVPFIPQEFNRPPPNSRLKCRIVFGPKGPLAKPPLLG